MPFNADRIASVRNKIPPSLSGKGERPNPFRGKRSTTAESQPNATSASSTRLSKETIISLSLIQLPGVMLAIFGIIKTFHDKGCQIEAFSGALRLLFKTQYV